MSDLKWFSKKIKLNELKDYKRNPRRIKRPDYERLVMSIQQMGYHNRI
jgi:ParB-like chromosome segregation protein Spo0J